MLKRVYFSSNKWKRWKFICHAKPRRTFTRRVPYGKRMFSAGLLFSIRSFCFTFQSILKHRVGNNCGCVEATCTHTYSVCICIGKRWCILLYWRFIDGLTSHNAIQLSGKSCHIFLFDFTDSLGLSWLMQNISHVAHTHAGVCTLRTHK